MRSGEWLNGTQSDDVSTMTRSCPTIRIDCHMSMDNWLIRVFTRCVGSDKAYTEVSHRGKSDDNVQTLAGDNKPPLTGVGTKRSQSGNVIAEDMNYSSN